MRDLSAYAAQCMRELDRLHICYAQNITFAVNTRAKTRLGVCKKQGDRYTVEIAAPLLDESMPEKLLKETLHHELLHSCRGCMQHTGRWKALAERVNAAYGYQITRTAEKDELPQGLVQQPRYRVICPHCGAVYDRYKRSALIDHPERYRCGKCRQPMVGAGVFYR